MLGATLDRIAETQVVQTHGVSGLSPDEFKQAFRGYPAGVSVVTADAGRGPVGMTATSVISLSAEPAMLAFSVSDLSSSAPTILESDTVVVHLLSAEQLEIAKLCSTSGIDRFEDATIWSRLPSGEPLFHEAQAWIRGRVVHQLRAGTATLVVLHALESGTVQLPTADVNDVEPEPLVYHNRTWHRIGDHSVAA